MNDSSAHGLCANGLRPHPGSDSLVLKTCDEHIRECRRLVTESRHGTDLPELPIAMYTKLMFHSLEAVNRSSTPMQHG
jgi:hypothetical protein